MVHEQKWEYRVLDGMVVDQSGRALTADDVSDEVLRFIAAAPAMARTLLHRVTCNRIDRCIECDNAYVALRKAGVLP